MEEEGASQTGLLCGAGAYGLWGVLPLYFHLLDDIAPIEVLFHRVVWSFVAVGVLLWVRGRIGEATSVPRDRAAFRMLVVASLLIGVNWLTFIWAVHHGHVLDAALGYYINPLLTVALGVLVLGERLRRPQSIALGFGAAAVVVLGVGYGAIPWVGLVLATSFAAYGYLKKSAAVAATPSLAVETAVLVPFALLGFAVFAAAGDLAAPSASLGTGVVLLGLGVVTATPLILFTAAATRIPLSMLGLLQYLAPTLQLLCGVVVLGEELPPERLAGFALVWVALTVLASDAVSAERRHRRALAPA